MTQNGTEEIDEATLLQDPDYKALVDYGINKVVAAELKKIYESGQSSYSIYLYILPHTLTDILGRFRHLDVYTLFK